jgi:predicted nucleic acid-binding Zn ribbon protein
MKHLLCKHCGNSVEVGDKNCPHCGIPLPPDLGRSAQRKFILYFIALIILSVLLMLWLPPDWTRFTE